MKKSNFANASKKLLLTGSLALVSSMLAFGVEANTRGFPTDQKAKIQGVIVSRAGDVLKLRADDDSIGTIDLTGDTKIQLKRALGRKTAMDVQALVPGLRIEAQGKGNEKGELVANHVLFDPNSMRAAREIDTRVSPLEARTSTLEGRTDALQGRTDTLENRTGQIENREGQLEQTEGQTQQQVSQVKTQADEANQGVANVNNRVNNLDNYQQVDSATVYFKLNSAVLSPEGKKDLDNLAQKVTTQKGYVIEVAGFTDTTGHASYNQVLSEARANAVTHYLEEQGNIPVYRILTPAGMGTSHEAASNDTPEGRKMNRRVEVTVLANQGVVGGAGTAETSAAKVPGADASR